jgi:hypothetical protein
LLIFFKYAAPISFEDFAIVSQSMMKEWSAGIGSYYYFVSSFETITGTYEDQRSFLFVPNPQPNSGANQLR